MAQWWSVNPTMCARNKARVLVGTGELGGSAQGCFHIGRCWSWLGGSRMAGVHCSSKLAGNCSLLAGALPDPMVRIVLLGGRAVWR
jgi:hypothetical protein